jgi:predicted AAA+ superfamily ATPase
MNDVTPLLARIAEALERLAPPPPGPAQLDSADAFLWNPDRLRHTGVLVPVPSVSRVDLSLLQGIDRARDLLLENTRRFAAGLPANNAMLWGARGMGKSSLIKAAHAAVNAATPRRPGPGGNRPRGHCHSCLPCLPSCATPRRFLVFCDDLSFERQDADYKALKSVLDGGIEGRPANVLFYATSNRRHLMPRDMIENEQATAINPARPPRKKCRSATASACGSAFTIATRRFFSAWWTPMQRPGACPSSR